MGEKIDIRNFGDLNISEKRVVLQYIFNKRGSIITTLTKSVIGQQGVIFCAFREGKCVGFATAAFEGDALNPRWVVSEPSRRLVEEKQTTVARLLEERLKTFAAEHKSRFINFIPITKSGRRALSRSLPIMPKTRRHK